MATALPAHVCERAEAQARFAALHGEAGQSRQVRAIFAHSGVDRRYLSRPVNDYPVTRGFGERNRRYQQDALALSVRVGQEVLARAELDPRAVTHLFFVTTTGLATPSLDAPLALELGLDPRVQRLPLFGLGCAGGAASMSRVGRLLAGASADVALVVAAELCGHTFDPADESSLGAVAASLFGDGAAAVLVAGPRAKLTRPALVPRIVDTESRLLPGTRHIMGWEFEDAGFRLVLSRELPALVAREVAGPVAELLARNGVELGGIRFPVIHPGGPRVLDAVAKGLGLAPERLAMSRAVLAEVGNLSSATVLFVLDRVLRSGEATAGDHALILAPGPGFALEMALVRFEQPD